MKQWWNLYGDYNYNVRNKRRERRVRIATVGGSYLLTEVVIVREEQYKYGVWR